MRELLQIGEVAKLIGVSPKTIRYYHEIGLLAEPKRTDGGYRLYTAQDLLRLQRIRRLRSLGLHLERIKEVLGESSVEQEVMLRNALHSKAALGSPQLENTLVDLAATLVSPAQRRFFEELSRKLSSSESNDYHILNVSSKMLAPLWTKHQLSATSLHLHYGLEFKAEIPRSTIIAARQVRERVAFPVASFDAEKRRIFAAFSDRGQVLLVLDQRYAFRVGLFGSSKSANQLLINVDQRDEFLADLDLQATSVERGDATSGGNGRSVTSVSTPHHTSPVPTRGGNLAICTENLTRRYKGFVAVDDLNLAVHTGEIYGFLGSNGAGKTTTMKMLVGLLQPDGGHAWIAGHDVWKESLLAKATFGYVADHTMLYDRLTGREFLDFLAQIRGISGQKAMERIEQLLDILELRDRAHTACGTYSFGMKRKLAMAGALIHEPQVLILDEPLNGLDPLSARRLKNLFAELAANGTTIFLSTHDLANAEMLCHRVGIIHKGHLLVEGSSSDLRENAGVPGLEEAFLSLTAENEELPV